MVERLWAPWRDAYVSTPAEQTSGCIFCEKPRQERDAENYILLRAEHVYVILNAYPYNNGHMMVVPYEHVGDLTAAAPPMLAEMMALSQRCVRVSRACLRQDGCNLGMNLGRPAGAGVADHIHLHIVPRWTGDTNFMPVLADTRVLSQALASSYAVLRKGFDEID